MQTGRRVNLWAHTSAYGWRGCRWPPKTALTLTEFMERVGTFGGRTASGGLSHELWRLRGEGVSVGGGRGRGCRSGGGVAGRGGGAAGEGADGVGVGGGAGGGARPSAARGAARA